MAQIINVNRPQGSPNVVTSGVQNVAGQVAADTDYTVTTTLQAADLNDTMLTCTYVLLLDGQPAWGPNDWRGGLVGHDGAVASPRLTYSTGAGLPSTAEVRYTFNKTLAGRFTADLTFPKVK